MTVKLRSLRNIGGIAIVLIAALALSACGGDEPTASGASTANGASNEEVQSITSKTSSAQIEPTAVSKIDPPEVALVPKEVPEPGSLQEDVLKVFEGQVRAMNTMDVQSYLDACLPSEANQSIEHLKLQWDEFDGDYGWFNPGFTLVGFNARNVDIRVYSSENVMATFDIYNHDELIGEAASRGYEKSDGIWYSTGRDCTGTMGRQ